MQLFSPPPQINLTVDKDFFDNNGYYIVRNVFSEQEVNRLRKVLYAIADHYRAEGHTRMKAYKNGRNWELIHGDYLSLPFVNELITDPRTLHIARTILGGTPHYFGYSQVALGFGHSGFHRDNVDRDQTGPEWEGDQLKVMRFGMYLQDHAYHSGGLKVRPGSHQGHDQSGKDVLVDNRVGDVVLWDPRTQHSGSAYRLKVAPKLSLHSGIETHMPIFLENLLCRPQQSQRIFMVHDYGLPNAALDYYIKHMVSERPQVRDLFLNNSPIKDEVMERVLNTPDLGFIAPNDDYGKHLEGAVRPISETALAQQLDLALQA